MTRDLTAGPPTRLIVLFAVPLLLGNLFQQLYHFTDAAVVGRLVGVDALAAVGATGSVTFLLLGLSWGSSTGLAIPVARAFGAGDPRAVRRAFAAGAVITAALAVAITVVGTVLARPFMVLLGTPAELLDDATTFLTVTFLGSAAMAAFNYLSSVVRALGDSRTPLLFLVTACVLNAGLVVALVGGAGLGVGGAALATVVAQLVSVVLCLVLVRRRMPVLHLHREDWRLERADLAEPLRLGMAMGFQMSVIAVGAMVLQSAINGLGAQAVTAFTVAARVDQLAVAPLNSFGLALATFVAQNRGALAWTRVRQGVLRTTGVSTAAAVVLGVLVAVAGAPIVRVFVGEGEEHVVGLAHQYLIISGCLYGFLALLFVYRNAVQGMGHATAPSVSGVAELVLRAVAGLVLVRYFGFVGVCLAAPLAWIGGLVPVAISWAAERRRLVRREQQPPVADVVPHRLPDEAPAAPALVPEPA